MTPPTLTNYPLPNFHYFPRSKTCRVATPGNNEKALCSNDFSRYYIAIFRGDHMKRRLFVATSVLILLTSTRAWGGNGRKMAIGAGVVNPGRTADGKGALLPTGWKITPAGQQVKLPGDMVMKIIVSPDGKTVFANTAGWHDHSVNMIDAQTGKVAESMDVAKVWAGMAMNPATGAIFVSGGGAPSAQFITLAKNRGIKPEM